ncbi:MAG: lytic transglycosylase F, partial [Pseudomonadota bacterium]
MNDIRWKKPILILITLVLLVLTVCTGRTRLNKIIESGRITAITRNSAHSYYTYREKPMGFEYDLA